jgi:hypothetical protein
MRERVHWRTVSPLWPAAAGGAVRFDRPAILRFAADDFMERFQAMLREGGERVPELVAQPETWRAPAAGLEAGNGTPNGPLTLYQPAQGRFYLLAATLVCSKYSLPDKPVEPGKQESVFFVVRRLRPRTRDAPDPDDPATFTEQGWIPEGPGEGAWRSAPLGALADGERRLGLFPLTQVAAGGSRRVLAGLIPVAAREVLEAGPTLPTTLPPGDPLAALADARLGPLVPIVEGLQLLARSAPTANRDDVLESLFYLALDLAEFLDEHVPTVLDSGGPAALRDLLTKRLIVADSASWLSALTTAHDIGAVVGVDAPPPAPFSQVSPAALPAAIGRLGVELTDAEDPNLERDPELTTLFKTIAAALPPPEEAAEAEDADGTEEEDAIRVPGADENAVYVARCVYERPLCPAPERLRVSGPSRPFQLAGFHDPDAPYRPSRIPTPVDTSLAALRRSPKAVAVSISAELRKQIDRIEGIKLGDLDDGKVNPERDLTLGMVCQLSIPIITICALILLMIIVSLLHIVFWWLPLFRICLPSVRRG